MATTTDSSGRVLVTEAPQVKAPPTQMLSGSIAQAAAAKTMDKQAAEAQAFKELGAGQKGAGRRRTKKRKYRGGSSQNVVASTLPTASSVPGGNPTDVSKKMVEMAAQVKASASYDKMANQPPIKIGGFRLRGAEDLYPGSGTESETKRKRKTKKKHGRRHRRTHRRSRRKSRNLRRRSRRHL